MVKISVISIFYQIKRKLYTYSEMYIIQIRQRRFLYPYPSYHHDFMKDLDKIVPELQVKILGPQVIKGNFCKGYT